LYRNKISGYADWCEQELGLRKNYFFLWRFLRRRFLRLWVAILWPFLFFPLGMWLVFILFN
ncbi:hypothetical protein, partial [Duncaniella muris]|uniref:hypothetical protein n=1 Tax=Duncaniella muris TaxID=2094150 RepID=UPI0025A58836